MARFQQNIFTNDNEMHTHDGVWGASRHNEIRAHSPHAPNSLDGMVLDVQNIRIKGQTVLSLHFKQNPFILIGKIHKHAVGGKTQPRGLVRMDGALYNSHDLAIGRSGVNPRQLVTIFGKVHVLIRYVLHFKDTLNLVGLTRQKTALGGNILVRSLVQIQYVQRFPSFRDE
jgi:hypothetical protein